MVASCVFICTDIGIALGSRGAFAALPAGHADSPRAVDAFIELVPEAGAPPNGGSANVGDRFVLDLMVHSGTNNVTAQQSYLTFTNSVLQNGRVSDIPTLCTLTSTVTFDHATFDADL